MRASMIAIDSGNWTQQVYAWVRKHQAKHVIAIKGSNQPNKPVINKPTAQERATCRPWLVRDLELSRPIYRQLAAYGHMGREELGVRWEDTDRTDALRAAVAETNV